MIADFLPVNMRDTTPLQFAAPAVAPLVANAYTFAATATFLAQGAALYLFDSYTFTSNITEQQFVHAVGFGAAGVTNNEFVPTVSFEFSGTQSGRPPYFPTFRPAAFGITPIRAYGVAPSDQEFLIQVKFNGVVKWDIAAYPSPPAFLTFLFGLNVYQIKNQDFIESYHTKMLAGNQWP